MNLHDGIAALGLSLPAGSEDKLAAFLALLAKWNRTYNLTAIRDPEQMVSHHLLDSLAILPHLDGIVTLADVGSGAGLPGLVLAIARPDRLVTSIEASQKKCAFQQQAKIELELANVSIHYGRAEVLKRTFDAAISRAFASLADFIHYAGHLSNRLLAMKGAYPADEVAALPPGWTLGASHPIAVPGLGAQRHLLILERA